MLNRSTFLTMWIRNAVAAFLLIYTPFCYGQDTLPNFTVTTKGNGSISIRWKNTFKKISQISIQRSHDSSRNFKTLLNVSDPRVSPYTYVDAKAPTPYMFYRLFIVIDSNTFLFSPTKRAYWDTLRSVPTDKKTLTAVPSIPTPATQKMDSLKAISSKNITTIINPTENNSKTSVSNDNNTLEKNNLRTSDPKIIPSEKTDPLITDSVKTTTVIKHTPLPATEKQITIKRRDTIAGKIPESKLRNFIDSIVTKTKDTFVLRYNDTLVIKPFVPKEVYRPSTSIFTDREGNVLIQLPDYAVKKYSVDLFDEKGRRLFTIEQIMESPLTIDKVNFLQSGWYRFELKEDGKMKEKNKFFIPKDL